MEKLDFGKICIGCMSKIQDKIKACPQCGMKIEEYLAKSYHLKPYTILNDKYLVGKVIEEKDFEIIYIGWDLNLKVKIAIKEYYPQKLACRENTEDSNIVLPYTQENRIVYESELKEFVEEAKNLAQFSDLCAVVTVKDFFEENGTAYVIMEYVDGVTLHDYLKASNERIDLNRIFELLKPLMESLSFIHNLGMTHGNINSDNIIINRYHTAKLINFKEKRLKIKEEQEPWIDIYGLCTTIYKEIIISSDKDKKILLKGMNLESKDRYETIKQLIKALEKQTNKKERKVFLYFWLNYHKNIIGGAVFFICIVVFFVTTTLATTNDIFEVQTMELNAGVSKNSSLSIEKKKLPLSIRYIADKDEKHQKKVWNIDGKGKLNLISDSLGEKESITWCRSVVNFNLDNIGTKTIKNPVVILKFKGIILCKNNDTDNFTYSGYKTDPVSQFSGYNKVTWRNKNKINSGKSLKFLLNLDNSLITNQNNAKVKIVVYEKNKAKKSCIIPIKFIQRTKKKENSNYKNNFYILEDSNCRYLTQSDLYGLSKGELRIARNEIYARKGRKFEDTQLQLYFNSMLWYHPIYETSEFTYDYFNEYEEANIDFIQNYEKTN